MLAMNKKEGRYIHTHKKEGRKKEGREKRMGEGGRTQNLLGFIFSLAPEILLSPLVLIAGRLGMMSSCLYSLCDSFLAW